MMSTYEAQLAVAGRAAARALSRTLRAARPRLINYEYHLIMRKMRAETGKSFDGFGLLFLRKLNKKYTLFRNWISLWDHIKKSYPIHFFFEL